MAKPGSRKTLAAAQVDDASSAPLTRGKKDEAGTPPPPKPLAGVFPGVPLS
ncbi:MAG: hypothetical protein JO073_08990 [Actinobacteria bacterium]|nr:hypothetical protein [Actinomycetota bacterium]